MNSLTGFQHGIPIIATILRALWFIAEKTHSARRSIAPARHLDKSSLKVLKSVTLVVPVGVAVGFTGVGHIHTEGNVLGVVGISLMLAGIIIRWAAIFTLGQYFTRKVMIFDDHRLVRHGLYRHLRHPSYTGYLLGNLGLGLAFSNWLSAVIIFAPMLAASLHRIRIEEHAMSENFGDEYLEYAKSTKRLIPKVY
jgi:protein-S-isoprenylcysteine O-methyltransferase Ste14